MKKLLVLLMILIMVASANATVVNVVKDAVGSMGHAGTAEDKLVLGETIGIKLVLQNNPYDYEGTPYPAYDGYFLSSFDFSLNAIGNGQMAPVQVAGPPPLFLPQDDLKNAAAISPFVYNKNATGFDQLTGVCLTPLGPGEADMVWNILFECTGDGPVLLDLSINGLSEYAEYEKAVLPGQTYTGNWIAMVEADLGDLTIHQIPEPMTMALLGLGGLFLRRKK